MVIERRRALACVVAKASSVVRSRSAQRDIGVSGSVDEWRGVAHRGRVEEWAGCVQVGGEVHVRGGDGGLGRWVIERIDEAENVLHAIVRVVKHTGSAIGFDKAKVTWHVVEASGRGMGGGHGRRQGEVGHARCTDVLLAVTVQGSDQLQIRRSFDQGRGLKKLRGAINVLADEEHVCDVVGVWTKDSKVGEVETRL